MGFCGYNKKDSARIAAYFGMVQGLLSLISECVFLEIFFAAPVRRPDEGFRFRFVLQYLAEFFNPGIKVLLVALVVLNCMWIVSSFLLLKGNEINIAGRVKQWVIFTGINTTLDVIIPGIVLGVTMMSFMFNVLSRSELPSRINSQLDPEFQVSGDDIRIALIAYYILFCLVVTRIGPVLPIINMCLMVYTNQRANELSVKPGWIISTRDQLSMQQQLKQRALEHL